MAKSASTPRLAQGAATLDSGMLSKMRDEVAALRSAAEHAKAEATAEAEALPPPLREGGLSGDCGEIRGSTRHPLFDRLLSTEDVEAHAGARLSSPLVMPCELSMAEEQLAERTAAPALTPPPPSASVDRRKAQAAPAHPAAPP